MFFSLYFLLGCKLSHSKSYVNNIGKVLIDVNVVKNVYLVMDESRVRLLLTARFQNIFSFKHVM